MRPSTVDEAAFQVWSQNMHNVALATAVTNGHGFVPNRLRLIAILSS